MHPNLLWCQHQQLSSASTVPVLGSSEMDWKRSNKKAGAGMGGRRALVVYSGSPHKHRCLHRGIMEVTGLPMSRAGSALP